MHDPEKACEARVRRLAKRQDLELRKWRGWRGAGFTPYGIIDPWMNAVVLEAVDLDGAEEWLRDLG